MDEENEILEDVERVRGIEEGEADHRMGEFRDLVRRIEDATRQIGELRDQLADHNTAVMQRFDTLAGIAVDNAGNGGYDESRDEGGEDDITARDWSELADELNI